MHYHCCWIKGANIHVIGCISNAGPVHYEVRRGAFRNKQACEWMRHCLPAAREKYGGPIVMVIDNAPCHTALEKVFQEEEFADNILMRLAPYSLDLFKIVTCTS